MFPGETGGSVRTGRNCWRHVLLVRLGRGRKRFLELRTPPIL